jgi:hypothetical protein
MTLEEKVAQLHCLWQQKRRILGDDGLLSPLVAWEIRRIGGGAVTAPRWLSTVESRAG